MLIEPIKEELKNSLGMIVSKNDEFQIRYRKAKALSVGPLVTCVTEGKTIYFDLPGSHEVIVNGQRLAVVAEHNIALVES